ncbi:MAG: DUF2141 domain-containing protein [Betaproteobacteria bacterium]|nr:DUF2141 domain-containing protein [Betaproteobacteria bacterium]
MTTAHHFLPALALVAALATGSAGADEATLAVTIRGVRDATGQLRVSLYNEAEGFRKEDRALKVITAPAAPGEASVEFAGLPPGRYALMAYHDENGDNKLNLRLGMFPTEGYALSNNPRVMGPPKFADSAFDVAAPLTRIEMTLAY